ncbi:MAG: alanine racemase [Clostridiaceae bacterium]
MRRSTYAEINLENIQHNIRFMRSRLKPETKYLAVVKANAYGHGMEQVARAALDCGAEYLGVAFAEEGVRLRDAGITAPVLLLGATDEAHMDVVIECGLIPTVFSLETIQCLQSHAKALHQTCRVHIKVDTGMNRLGFSNETEFLKALELLKQCPNLVLDGLFTHFAVSELPDPSFTLGQAERFRGFAALAREHGFTPILHASNSAAAIHLPETQFDMVRGGIAMYGCHPAGHPVAGIDLRPGMRWHTAITHIKTIGANEGVSYGLKFVSPCEMRIGTLAVGYGDGYKRCLSGKADVLVRGKRAHQIGTICMDQMMIDLSNIPEAEVGDDVILIGSQGAEEITADELAEKAGTISYEILLSISDRVPRFY